MVQDDRLNLFSGTSLHFWFQYVRLLVVFLLLQA